ncbi:hypothetical protein CEXT_366291 [Caerostris extrusa]|uniref:Ribosomal protein L16 n=1 Tax=Caerostris extrusa TaxID=172846 RepID=A0AAV4UF17_CAEEX|nr:hypothetical protein CEXT_366291 [Caerostris extrusa]
MSIVLTELLVNLSGTKAQFLEKIEKPFRVIFTSERRTSTSRTSILFRILGGSARKSRARFFMAPAKSLPRYFYFRAKDIHIQDKYPVPYLGGVPVKVKRVSLRPCAKDLQAFPDLCEEELSAKLCPRALAAKG